MIALSTAVRQAQRLMSKTCKNPRLEAEILLGHILKKDRVWLKTNTEKNLSFWTYLQLLCYSWKRRCGLPLAYICGRKHWADFELAVDQNVLIPRDETEILCHHIVNAMRNWQPKSILDIGTGSGAIALFLKRHFPNAKILATDLSPTALEIARRNAEKHNFDIQFQHSDLLQSIPQNAPFDLITANLPYVPNEMSVSREVQKEPRNAIFSGSDGLDHIRALAQQLQAKNINFRELWLEFLPQQYPSIEKIFEKYEVIPFEDEGGDIFFAKITLQKIDVT